MIHGHQRTSIVWTGGDKDAETLRGPRWSSRKGEVGGEFSDAVFPAHLLEFHPAVLEPDLDLSVTQVHALADL